MNQSEDIKELVGALSKAQGQMKPAVFNRVNPHYKNKYADFTSCMDACREPLSSNGLSIMQYCENQNEKLYLVTMLAHVSGQWIKSFFPLNPKNMDSQSIGSSMTYGKRYSLSAILGIVSDDEDDDGESEHNRSSHNVKPVTISPPAEKPKPILEPSQEIAENETKKFLLQFNEENSDMLQEYFLKYSEHWKKSLWKSLQDYVNVPEKFLKDFYLWRKKYYPEEP